MGRRSIVSDAGNDLVAKPPGADGQVDTAGQDDKGHPDGLERRLYKHTDVVC